MASNRPIFVIGCPRSGTTMLSLMLHAHSRIAMPPETRFLTWVYRNHASFGDLSERENRRELALAIVKRRGTMFRDLGLDRGAVRKAIVEGPPTVGSAVGTVFRSYAQRFGKERWGDKRPGYYQNMDAIQAMFPQAQFVHLIRDGRDCVASLARVPWFTGGVIGGLALWTEAVDFGRRAARRLPADTFYELKYEDLVADPSGELQRLCDYLGEDFEDAMLEPHRVAGQAVPDRKHWHANTRRPLSADSIGGYGEVLGPAEVRLINFVAGRRLRRLGYDAPPTRRPPPSALVARYVLRSARHRLRVRLRIIGDRRIARSGTPLEDRG